MFGHFVRSGFGPFCLSFHSFVGIAAASRPNRGLCAHALRGPPALGRFDMRTGAPRRANPSDTSVLEVYRGIVVVREAWGTFSARIRNLTLFAPIARRRLASRRFSGPSSLRESGIEQ